MNVFVFRERFNGDFGPADELYRWTSLEQKNSHSNEMLKRKLL